jgi:hypothetical protein
MQHDPGGANPVAELQRVLERDQRLGADLVLHRCTVDEVDGVDHDRVELRGVHRLAKFRDLLVAAHGGAPGARALMKDLDRIGVALGPALDGAGQPTRCGNMRADQHRA